jgi:hypothetical protein
MLRFLARPLTGLALLMALFFVTAAFSGGFYLRAELPPASSDPALKDAVLVVRPDGCREPSMAKLTATAEGLLDGERTTRQVRLRPITRGQYAITRQWPSEGDWVLKVTATYDGMTTGMLLLLGPNGAVSKDIAKGGIEKLPLRLDGREFGEPDIAEALADAARKGRDQELLPVGTP